MVIEGWKRPQKSWQIRRGEVYVQKGYCWHGHMVDLNCGGGISAEHMKHRGLIEN
jgi:hypothetical protein